MDISLEYKNNKTTKENHIMALGKQQMAHKKQLFELLDVPLGDSNFTALYFMARGVCMTLRNISAKKKGKKDGRPSKEPYKSFYPSCIKDGVISHVYATNASGGKQQFQNALWVSKPRFGRRELTPTHE